MRFFSTKQNAFRKCKQNIFVQIKLNVTKYDVLLICDSFVFIQNKNKMPF